MAEARHSLGRHTLGATGEDISPISGVSRVVADDEIVIAVTVDITSWSRGPTEHVGRALGPWNGQIWFSC